MNPDLIRIKLLETKVLFIEDWDVQDVVMKNLERAVPVCVDLANHWLADDAGPPPASMARVAVHEYENLDYGRIDEALSDLGVFDDYGRALLKALG